MYKIIQTIKTKKNNNKKQSFIRGLEQVWYKLLYIVIFQRKDNKEEELNIHTDINISNKKKL